MREFQLTMDIISQSATAQRSFNLGSVAGCRFSSRDVEAMRRQMDEQIAREGYYTGATRTNPSVFRIGRYLLTQDAEFEVQGPLTGGEAEVVAIRDSNEIFITVGSDQCDRELDPIFPDKPKQLCPHPIATTAWPYAEVKDHWDELKIYGETRVKGHAVPLQDTAIVSQVNLEYLLAMPQISALPDSMVFYCGATPFMEESIAALIAQHDLPEETAHGTGDTFLCRLHDPVLNRTIEHEFAAVPLGDDLEERRQSERPISPGH
jgi:hypothetical protein